MGKTVTHALAATFALMTLAISALPAWAQTTLTFSSWLPPRHPIVVNAFKPWAEDVETATEGRVKIRMLARPLGSPVAHFEFARDGVADITYGLHSFTPGNLFVLTRAAQFSFMGDDAISLSKAFWNAHQAHFAQADEHAGTHLLGLFAHGPGVLHNGVRKIESVADVAGLKLRTPGGYISDLMTAMEASVVLTPAGEVYENLSRGVIDGVTFTHEALTAFKLTEFIKYSTTFPGGLYNTSWFFVMNQEKWDSLSVEDQTAISMLSGAAFAERVGQAWNDADAAAMGPIAEAGIETYPAPQAMVLEVKALAENFEAGWAEEARARGVADPLAVIAEMRAEAGVVLP